MGGAVGDDSVLDLFDPGPGSGFVGCPQAKGRLKLCQGAVELFGDPAQGVGAFGEGDVCPEGLQLQALASEAPRFVDPFDTGSGH